MSDTDPTYGLVLDAGPSAAPYAHRVGDLPGLYRHDVPTPVGDSCDINLDHARTLDADPNFPLRLVEIPAVELAKVTATVVADKKASRAGAVAARKTAVGDLEREAVSAELTATTPR